MLLNFFFLLGALIVLSSCATQKLCPQVILHSDERIKLTDTEKRLVCGDKKVEAYKKIPPYQAAYLFEGFLQSRGYIRPQFEYVDDKVHIFAGVKSRVDKVNVTSENPEETTFVKKEIRRVYHGLELNPRTLDEIEGQTKSFMRQRGFACAKVASEVDTNDDTITLNLSRLKPHIFGEFEKEEIEGVDEKALDRFYPFTPKDKFNENLLTLNEKRLQRAGVVQGSYFEETCSENGDEFSFKQKFIVSPPRTLRFGAGASTEVGPMARAKWSHSRYGNMASLLEASVMASFKSQSFILRSDNFWWTDRPRQSFLASVELTRQSQTDYEETLLQFKPHMKWTQDTYTRNFIWTVGPTYQAGSYKTDDSSLTRHLSTGALEGSLTSSSHTYETFDIHPEDGNMFQFSFDFRHPAMGFVDPLLKLDTSFVNLTKVANWGRGSAIAGLRLNASTTWVPDEVSLASLPPSVKFYGGGSDDIRGLTLRSLPENNGAGALTKLLSKFELRKTHTFHETLESFIFTDIGYFGERPWEIKYSAYYSPGVGLRWFSPIGLVQTYISRAYAANPFKDYGNFYYLGLGGVF